MNPNELIHRPRGFKPLASGIEGPEGPALGPDGCMYFVSSDNASILKISSDDQVSTVLTLSGRPNGLAFGNDGEMYIADAGSKSILRYSGKGKPEVYTDNYDGASFSGPNDICVMEDGSLLFTDPLRLPPPDPSMSPVFKVDTTGITEPFITDLAYPNGIAISYDKSEVIVSESKANRLIATNLQTKESQAINQRLVRRFKEPGRPDGIAIDIGENILVCLPGIHSIAKLDKKGEMLDLFHVPNWQPENLAFGGPENKTLYVCSGLQSAVHTFKNDLPGIKLPIGNN